MKEKSHNEKRLFTLHAGNYFAKQREFLLSQIARLDDKKSWEISISKRGKKRTYQQLKALFGLAYKTICATTGYEKDELHTVMLGEFTGWEEVEILGVKRLVPKKTTSEMEAKEMSEFFEFIQRRAAFIGVYIPDPNEYEQMSEAA